jgi:hypothetical protein
MRFSERVDEAEAHVVLSRYLPTSLYNQQADISADMQYFNRERIALPLSKSRLL